MKNLIVFTFIIFISLTKIFASHFMGGEIWWVCLPDGKYQFRVHLFQECYGIDYQVTETIECTNIPGLTSFPINLVSITDLTPTCNTNPIFPHITCDGVTLPNQGGFKQWNYESTPIALPTTPIPASGWIFTVNICNRNSCSNIINATSYCGCLRAIMYPYNNMPASPCFDNSPYFAEGPKLVFSTAYPQTLYQDVTDAENDSVAFSWANPWSELNIPITSYGPGYSFNSPLPGTMQNPQNIPAVLNSTTGEVSFTSYTQGAFVLCIKASTWKNGVHVADIFKEAQVVLLATNFNVINFTPLLIEPFPVNTNPWTDTIDIGEHITFQVGAVDTGLLNDSISPQNITLLADGIFLGSGDTSSSAGCPVPPCATLNVSTPVTATIINSVLFEWQPGINHLLYHNDPPGDKEFIFHFDFTDDFCPVPANIRKTLRIILRNPDLPPPVMTSYIINTLNDELTVFWDPVQDTSGLFDKYYIYLKNDLAGNFQLTDSIENLNQNLYTFSQPMLPGQWFWCEMRTKTITNISGFSNVLTNYYTGNSAHQKLPFIQITWNPGEQSVILEGILDQGKEFEFSLFDVLGISHYQQKINLVSGPVLKKIPVNLHSPGSYYFMLSDKFLKNTGKLMITR